MTETTRFRGTNTAKQVFRRNGEVFAVTYKKKPIETRPPIDKVTTTYKSSFVQPSSASTTRKPLVPYHANSMRNRLPVVFPTDPKTKSRYCKSNPNKTNYSIEQKGQKVSEASRFRTINKTTFAQAQMGVGSSNQGIVSEKTRWVHKRLQD